MTDFSGPAFPDCQEYNGEQGMTLREYYVGQLLADMDTDLSDTALAWFEQIGAPRVVKMADIMIAELNKETPND